MSQATRNQSRRRTVRSVTVASLGVGLAVAAASGVASADPAAPSPADIVKSVQHQAAETRPDAGRTKPAQTGTARPAAATPIPQPASAQAGNTPEPRATPLRDAIAKLVKRNVLNQLTGGLGTLFGPSR